MKSLRPMSIGGCIVAGLIVVLQPLPSVQLVVVVAAGVFGLVALSTLAIDAIYPHPAPQPVAQPVAQPVDDPVQPPQPVAESWSQPAQPAQPVADRWSQPLAQPVVLDMQPPATARATASQPARRPADIMASMIVDEVPPMRPVPWLEQKVAPVAVDDDPAELPGTTEPGLPLPRRAPTAAEYPLVWRAIQDAGSMNAAILAVYGSKDGKTHRWVSRVVSFYRSIDSGPMPLGTQFVAAVFHHELIGSCDMPGIVAARLGLEIDDDQLDELMAGLDQCDDCSAWYLFDGDCPCQQQEEVE